MTALRKKFLCSVAMASAIVLVPSGALAQDGAEAAEEEPVAGTDGQALEHDVIVVTGTLVRGVAPAGASVLTTTDADIESTGAATVGQLLETIPQLGFFNKIEQPLAQSPEVAVNRPNLRNLPGFNTAGGSTTLVLMDGHRMVGMGVLSTTPDPDVIPPGVIRRLEIVPDGGSAIYGSDAVAGVMNFVTIDGFDGLKVDASYGFADDYYQYNGNITGGIDWGTGSIFASYAIAKNDEILGGDRDYIKEFPTSNGFRSLECEPGNIQARAGVYGTPAGTVVGVNGGEVNDCDTSEFATLTPASERHSVFAGLNQDLSDTLTIDLRGYYSNRQTDIQSGPFRDSRIIVPSFFAGTAQALGIPALTSPFNVFNFDGFVNGQPSFVPGTPNGVDLVQDVSFQFGPNDARTTAIELDTWGIATEFTLDIDGNFQGRLLGNYGQSTTTLRSRTINPDALDNAIELGLFNPFDPSSSDPAALDIIGNFNDFGRSRQRLVNFRGIVDGSLADFGAGAVKIAVGAEFIKEFFDSRRGLGVPGFEFSGADAQFVGDDLVAPEVAGIPHFSVSREVKSAFGEIVAPLWRNDGGVELTVALSGRYDDYSDFGDTFNPRVGVTFKPVDWVALRGAWGESFNAPSLADSPEADVNRLFSLTGSAGAFFEPPAELQASNGGPYPDYDGGAIVALRGNAPGIQPQEAQTWTVGIDLDPPFVPGLRASVSYYNIDYTNLIGLAPFEIPAVLYRDFGFLINTAPTQAELDALIALADVFEQTPVTNPDQVYALIDARKRNFGGFKLDGIDFHVNYRVPTDFGSVFFNSSGTYELGRERQTVPGADYQDELSFNTNRFRARTTLGAEAGPVLGQISWNFSEGYELDPSVGFVPQDRVGDFNTFDLFFKFDVPGEGLARDLAFTANVRNVFDQAPPEFRGNIFVPGQKGVANGLTIGRLVQFGISKKF